MQTSETQAQPNPLLQLGVIDNNAMVFISNHTAVNMSQLYIDECMEILAFKVKLKVILEELQEDQSKYTKEDILNAGETALDHMVQLYQILDGEIENLYKIIASTIKHFAHRKDTYSQFIDEHYLFRTRSMLRFISEIEIFLGEIGAYYSILQGSPIFKDDDKATLEINQRLEEVANFTEDLEDLTIPIREYGFFSEISYYQMQYGKTFTNLKESTTEQFRNTLLHATYMIWSRLYLETARPDHVSIFLITSAKALEKIIADPHLTLAQKHPFCLLYSKIFGAIQAAETINKAAFLNYTPQLFAQIAELETCNLMSDATRIKFTQDVDHLVYRLDYKDSKTMLLYTFYVTMMANDIKIKILTTSHPHDLFKEGNIEKFFNLTKEAVEVMSFAREALLTNDEFGINAISKPLQFSAGKFFNCSCKTKDLLFAACEILLANTHHKITSLKKYKGAKINNLIETEFKKSEDILNQIVARIRIINAEQNLILLEALTKNPLSLEFIFQHILESMRASILHAAAQMNLEIHNFENEPMVFPLPHNVVGVFIRDLDAKMEEKIGDYISRLQRQREGVLPKSKASVVKHAEKPLTTADLHKRPLQSAPFADEELEKPSKKKKKRNRHKKKQATVVTCSTSSTSQVAIDEDDDLPKVEMIYASKEEALLNEAMSLYSNKKKYESKTLLNNCIILANQTQNHVVLVRALHAKISHTIEDVEAIKKQILTYEQLCDPDVRYNLEAMSKGMYAWHKFNVFIKEIRDGREVMKQAFLKVIETGNISADILCNARAEIERFEMICKEYCAYLENEIKKQKEGQEEFYAANPNLPNKGPGVFGALMYRTRNALSSLTTIQSTMKQVGSSIDKVVYKKPNGTLAQIQRPIEEVQPASTSTSQSYKLTWSSVVKGEKENEKATDYKHVESFLSTIFEAGNSITNFALISVLYSTATSESPHIIVSGIHKGKMLQANICDANGVIPDAIAQYVKNNLIKSSDSPAIFTYKESTLKSR